MGVSLPFPFYAYEAAQRAHLPLACATSEVGEWHVTSCLERFRHQLRRRRVSRCFVVLMLTAAERLKAAAQASLKHSNYVVHLLAFIREYFMNEVI